MTTTPPRRPGAISEWLIVIVLWIIAAALGGYSLWLLGVSIYEWLRHGFWYHPSLIDIGNQWGFEAVSTDWVTIDRLWIWFLTLPFSALALPAAAWIAVWAFAKDRMADQNDRAFRTAPKNAKSPPA